MSGELPPIGFWSYSRDDDTDSFGWLKKTRVRLTARLRQKMGRRDTRIWQDQEAIPTGADWQKRIETAIAESSFFVPIVTRGFLKSKWCCKELLLFADRAKMLGRDDLIFPFHYVSVGGPNSLVASDCHDPRVLDVLRKPQWVDFTLREWHASDLDNGNDADAKMLRLQLDDLATHIHGALTLAAASLAAATVAEPLPSSPTRPVPSTTPTETRGVSSTVQSLAAPAIRATPGTSSPAPVPATAAAPRVPPPPAPAKPGDIMRDAPDLPEMVLIPPGTYLRGVPTAESQREGTDDDNARPVRPVTIQQSFWMGRYPVTWGEFAAFIDSTGYKMPNEAWTYEPNAKGEWSNGKRDNRSWRNPGFKQTDRDPVVCVSHEDAQAYIAWLNQRTDGGYRLPSDAEWEYAARAGTQTARYWGDGVEQAYLYANMADQSLRKHLGPAAAGRSFTDGDDGYVFTSPVGSFGANGFGLHDMLGNIWEWCADTWHTSYEGAPTDGSAWVGDAASARVIRGGSWFAGARRGRAAYRRGFAPADRDGSLGFRCARVQRESDQGGSGA